MADKSKDEVKVPAGFEKVDDPDNPGDYLILSAKDAAEFREKAAKETKETKSAKQPSPLPPLGASGGEKKP